jgi:hypothetical protein
LRAQQALDAGNAVKLFLPVNDGLMAKWEGAVPSLSLSFMKAAALTVSKNEVESKLSVVPALRAQQALDAAVKLFLPVNDGLMAKWEEQSPLSLSRS